MKVEDLMIGDLVTITEPDDFHGYIGKVVITNAETNYITVHIPNMHLHDVFVEDLQPIPLTEEILKKNEYSYNETRDAWELIPNNGFGICKDEDDNCFYFCLGIFDAFNSYSDITYHYITKVEYVHELQHSLKLCGIKKEIIL